MTQKILLASSSASRKQLLSQLFQTFDCFAPDIDETPRKAEAAPALALRLSREKALKAAQYYPAHLIIAGDQTAVCDKRQLNKPGSVDNAIEQLQFCNGKSVTFYSGICLYNPQSKAIQLDTVSFEVVFRQLSDAAIRAYVETDQPLHSAGAFKFESLGIALFSQTEGSDPNALIGLPLIRLCDFLHNEGVEPLLGQT